MCIPVNRSPIPTGAPIKALVWSIWIWSKNDFRFLNAGVATCKSTFLCRTVAKWALVNKNPHLMTFPYSWRRRLRLINPWFRRLRTSKIMTLSTLPLQQINENKWICGVDDAESTKRKCKFKTTSTKLKLEDSFTFLSGFFSHFLLRFCLQTGAVEG